MQNFLIAFVVSYLIGSFPTAYLIVKYTTHLDIRAVGSGNVGGRNALDVTGKRWVGIVVVAIDVLKGAAAVALVSWMTDADIMAVSVSMAAVVAGHCYPVWLRWKGGRGLATAAGVFLWLSWLWVPVWLVVYAVAGKVTKDIHLSSVIALIGTPVIAGVLPGGIIPGQTPDSFTTGQFIVAGSAVIAVALTRHVEPLRSRFKNTSAHET